jgi:hydrogenase maturation protein HypF
MRHFDMCPQCQAEYNDPQNRRFHAQPNACPQCGPSLALWHRDGACRSTHHDALQSAADAILRGAIVAVKGLGGFHLMVDARNEMAIRRLRQSKHREEKPFALMVPSLAVAHRHCHISPLESHLLSSPASPIVLLRRKSSMVAAAVAPGNPNLGVMLPYTPLHHLLLRTLGDQSSDDRPIPRTLQQQTPVVSNAG